MKVVVAPGLAAAGVEILRERLANVELVVTDDPAGFRGELADADAAVCNALTPADTVDAGRLRLVQAPSAGADRVERGALPPGCILCNVRGHERAIAEWALMAMLALPRQIIPLDRDLRRGVWHRFGDERLDLGEPELEGKTVGVIGWGQIGRAVGGLARAVGANIIAVSRTVHGGVRSLDQLAWLLDASDFAVIALPLTEETDGLIGAAELDRLGPSGYLVNVARGQIADEHALFEALRDRRIAGAALDVWWNYPTAAGETVLPSRLPFHELDNVLMTPHTSGRSRRATRLRWEFIADQIERLARGEPLENVVFKASVSTAARNAEVLPS